MNQVSSLYSIIQIDLKSVINALLQIDTANIKTIIGMTFMNDKRKYYVSVFHKSVLENRNVIIGGGLFCREHHSFFDIKSNTNMVLLAFTMQIISDIDFVMTCSAFTFFVLDFFSHNSSVNRNQIKKIVVNSYPCYTYHIIIL